MLREVTTTVGLASGRRVEHTALANGTLSHMPEFDDGHRPSDRHLNCVVHRPARRASASPTRLAELIRRHLAHRHLAVGGRRGDPAIAALDVVDYDDEVEETFLAASDSFFCYPASIEFDVGGTPQRSLYTNPRGYDPTIPLSTGVVVAKFHSTVSSLLSEAGGARVVDLVLEGAGTEPVAEVMRILVPGA